MVEPKKPIKKKELIRLDEEIASKLQAEFDEEAKIKADCELAQKVQEQEELGDAEMDTLFLNPRASAQNKDAKSHNTTKRYVPVEKTSESKKPERLYFDSIQKMFDRAFKRVNTFVDFRTNLVEGSSKRAGTELEQESIKKQKVDEDKETAELQSLIKVIPYEEEVAIDVVPLATKPPTIVDWKIHKKGKKSYYQIIRADRKSQMYRVFS
ncbi:hypothetical protein Tco_1183293 [Tanacetum coccineum]